MIDAGVGLAANEENLDGPDRGENGSEVNVDSNERELEDTNGEWWFFDTASDIHVTGNRSYYVAFTEDTSESQSVHGVTPAMASRIAGVGTVAVVTKVDGERREFYLDDVFYVPGAEQGLFSPGLAAEQGLDFEYERETMNFRVMHEGRTMFVAAPYEST
ncbi:hypothetical protein PI124_g22719 [Phytophthora idaei]|nr:hypothetical protein PI125_g24582 [Phytophthora idaei]KAG3125762.1 hypothetical protein PI126_g22621 [Phytophthora idaei]KAG3232193.1 hypothetical protein PI124_g22719 [Phytophthora idaei]